MTARFYMLSLALSSAGGAVIEGRQIDEADLESPRIATYRALLISGQLHQRATLQAVARIECQVQSVDADAAIAYFYLNNQPAAVMGLLVGRSPQADGATAMIVDECARSAAITRGGPLHWSDYKFSDVRRPMAYVVALDAPPEPNQAIVLDRAQRMLAAAYFLEAGALVHTRRNRVADFYHR